MVYRIVSLDGGGIRGILTARVLSRLGGEIPGYLDSVDLFAGTSTGGILALGLAAGMTPDDLVDLYRDNAALIFQEGWLHDLTHLHGIVGARHASRGLRQALAQTFETKLHRTDLDSLDHRVLIPAFDLESTPSSAQGSRDRPAGAWKPKFFHNFPGPDSDGDQSILDVALRTSAAPTYFPTYQGYIDGGVVATNPSMAALAQALHPATGGQRLEDVRLLSLGTGDVPRRIPGRTHDWGLLPWAPKIVDLLLEGMSGVADYECRQILGGTRYCRLNPRFLTDIGMDDYERVDELVRIADALDLSTVSAWIGSHW